VLTVGDNAYENGTREDVITRYLVPYADLLARVPLFAAIGNHDTYHDNAKSFLEMVELPGHERYYGFRWGSAHFICLDTNIDYGIGSEQRRWLGEELLRAQDAKWRIVYFHHPLYSSSANGSELDARTALGPIFDEQRIDLVLSGHDHNYERTVPIRGSKAAGEAAPSYADPEGTIYIVTGGGGKRLYPSGTSWWTVMSRSVHHYLRVTIAGVLLTVEARDADDQLFDTVTIAKTLR
jgi:3',5'-cyclic AMP phosphodiesterase CpdA